ncbi:MAG: AMP-binding protein, partial [Candidatus Parcubacteria bacterium]|nr:AMP-binding protein [Burkholderiales bacterium]
MNSSIAAAIAPLEGLTVGEVLRRSARLHPGNVFFKGDGLRASFADFDAAVDRLATALLQLGIGRGDHVALWLPNSYEWALVFCASARIGAVVVPINTRYTAPEAAYILRQSDARLLVLTRRLWGKDYAQLLEGVLSELGSASMLRHVAWVKGEGAAGLDFASLAARP